MDGYSFPLKNTLSLVHLSDIVDIKPANMEELTEVITSAEFHPQQCHTFAYSSSKGSIRLCDMRLAALCDKHCKCEYPRRQPLISVATETWSSSFCRTCFFVNFLFLHAFQTSRFLFFLL